MEYWELALLLIATPFALFALFWMVIGVSVLGFLMFMLLDNLYNKIRLFLWRRKPPNKKVEHIKKINKE